MAQVLSLRDRLARALPRGERDPRAGHIDPTLSDPAVVHACARGALPFPLPPTARISTARPFDSEWDDPRKAANHAPDSA